MDIRIRVLIEAIVPDGADLVQLEKRVEETIGMDFSIEFREMKVVGIDACVSDDE